MLYLCSTLRNSDITYLGKSLIPDHVTRSSQWEHCRWALSFLPQGTLCIARPSISCREIMFQKYIFKKLEGVLAPDTIQEIHSWIATLSLTETGYWLFSEVMNKQPDNSGTFQMAYVTAWLEYNFQISSTSCPCSWHKDTGWSTP